MLLEGNLKGFPPSEILQWADTSHLSGVLVVSSGPGYRFHFRDGKIVAGQQSFLKSGFVTYLKRFSLLEPIALKRLDLKAKQEMTSAALVCWREGLMNNFEGVFRSYSADIFYSLVAESEGAFFFSQAAEALPDGFGTPLPPMELLLEAARRSDEESRIRPFAIPAGSTLKWVGREDQPEIGKLGQLLRSSMQGYRNTLEDILGRVPEETYLIRIELAKLRADGYVAVKPAPQRVGFGSDFKGEDPTTYRIRALPTADEVLFLSAEEAKILAILGRSGARRKRSLKRSEMPSSEFEKVLDHLAWSGWICRERDRPATRWAAGLAAVALPVLVAGGISLNRQAKDLLPRVPSQAIVEPMPWEIVKSESRQELELLVAESYEALLAGDIAGAQERLVKVEMVFLEDHQVMQLRMRIDQARNQQQADEEQRERADQEQRERIRRGKRLAEAALEAERFEEAARLLSEIAALAPNDTGTQELLRRALVNRKPREAPSPVKPFEEPADIRAKAEPEISAKPQPARVATMQPFLVNAVPYAYVRVDGQEHGVTPVQLNLPAGLHTVEVFREGYRSESRTIELEGTDLWVEAFVLAVDPNQEPRL